jgi:hypothetical protein
MRKDTEGKVKILLAGPWLGEFGWECAVWAPLIRRHSHKFDKTVIVCRSGHGYLYEDFAGAVIDYDKKGLSDRWLFNGKKVDMPQNIAAMYPDATLCRPRQGKCMEWPREYYPYGTGQGEKYDIVIHARAETKHGQKCWNYPIKSFLEVLNILGIDAGRCASIGSVSGASYVPGTKDLRGIPLNRLAAVLSNSGVCVSPSSGPEHFAHICRCKTVVITSNEWQKSVGGTNKDRYYKLWRAWDTPVKVLDNDNWLPSPEKVAKAVGKML